MPRKNLIRTSEYPYHISTRSNNQEWFYIPTGHVWSYCHELLKEGRDQFSIEVDAFVLMSNHYHLCLKTPEANIDKFMHFFNKNLGQKISRQANRINRIFGAAYKWNLVTSEAYYQNVIRYIYQNPLRAGLVEKCEDYPFSNLLEKNYPAEKRAWFNQALSLEENKKTKTKLRKYQVGLD